MISGRVGRPLDMRPRFLWCLAVVLGAFGLLAFRLAYLQVLQGPRYRHLSENNRIRLERVLPPRGMILDRRGAVLAEMRPSFDAAVIPAELPRAERPALYAQMAAVLALPAEQIAQVVEAPGAPRWKPRPVKRRLSRPEMAILEAHRLELTGVVVQANPVRYYPFGDLLGATLGYVGEISPTELRQPAYAEYEAGDTLGRSALEWAWEGELRGRAGGQQVEVDVRGRKLGVLAEVHPVPGRNVVAALDLRIQEAAERALAEAPGSVVVLDVRSGDVLAMASRPGYDPNALAGGISAEQWAGLAEDPLHPLQHRGIQAMYPPGSTFKIVTALAGLGEGRIAPQTKMYCAGEYHFAGRPYRCWRKQGHGWVDLHDAIVQSCDVYFYDLGLQLGVDTIQRYALELGLGQRTEIDLPSEKEGLVPSKAWKRRARGEPWYQGETLSIAIGQGYVLTTPLQLAAMTAAVAHPQGLRMRPRIVLRTEDPEGQTVLEIPPREVGRLAVRATHLAAVRQALRGVVAEEKGTARKAEVTGFPVAGKTGTAQVVKLPVDRDLEEELIPWERRDHALFVAFAPADDPQIAVAVVLEHGGHGGAAAAPVAQAVISAYRESQREGVSMGSRTL